jgi:ribose transport system substrate-binding protein
MDCRLPTGGGRNELRSPQARMADKSLIGTPCSARGSQRTNKMTLNENEVLINRRRAIQRMLRVGTSIAGITAASGAKSLGQISPSQRSFGVAYTKLTIPVIVRDRRSAFWQTVLSGARKAGQDLGVEIIELGTDSESDAEGQVGMLETVMASNPSAIVIAPASSDTVRKPIENAAKKTKIVGIDYDEESMAFASSLRTDNTQAGRLAADVLADAIKRTYADAEGDVAIITPLVDVGSIGQRATGFKDQVAAKYGALDVVAHKIGDAQANTGFSTMMELISDYPELRGVFVADLVMAGGAAQALAGKNTNTNGDIINFVSFDADSALVQMLRDGTVAALVVQDPFRMGYEGVKTAHAASRNERVPTHVDTDASLITKANMNSPRSRELLGLKIN